MEYPIYTVLGVLVIIYLFFLIYNRNKSKSRKSKKFMEDYRRKDRNEKEN
jgi:hypothetical protein